MDKRMHAGYTQGQTHASRPLYESAMDAYEPFREATTIRIALFSIITGYTKRLQNKLRHA